MSLVSRLSRYLEWLSQLSLAYDHTYRDWIVFFSQSFQLIGANVAYLPINFFRWRRCDRCIVADNPFTYFYESDKNAAWCYRLFLLALLNNRKRASRRGDNPCTWEARPSHERAFSYRPRALFPCCSWYSFPLALEVEGMAEPWYCFLLRTASSLGRPASLSEIRKSCHSARPLSVPRRPPRTFAGPCAASGSVWRSVKEYHSLFSCTTRIGLIAKFSSR